MAISALGFLLGRLVAQQQGVQDPNDVNKAALVGSVAGASPVGLALTVAIARREAQDEQAAPGPAGGPGGRARRPAPPRVIRPSGPLDLSAGVQDTIIRGTATVGTLVELWQADPANLRAIGPGGVRVASTTLQGSDTLFTFALANLNLDATYNFVVTATDSANPDPNTYQSRPTVVPRITTTSVEARALPAGAARERAAMAPEEGSLARVTSGTAAAVMTAPTAVRPASERIVNMLFELLPADNSAFFRVDGYPRERWVNALLELVGYAPLTSDEIRAMWDTRDREAEEETERAERQGEPRELSNEELAAILQSGEWPMTSENYPATDAVNAELQRRGYGRVRAAQIREVMDRIRQDGEG